MNAAQCLLDGGDDGSIAVVCGRERMRRGELRAAVARAAAAWQARGLARGDRVAIKLPDGCDWLVAYLGAIWAGGVAVGVNPRVPADEWRVIVDAAGFRAVLAEADDDPASGPHTPQLALGDWQREHDHATPLAALPMDALDPALWVHSSGTSGRPKAVVHGQRFALEIERVGAERLGIGGGDRLYASSKLFFAYPLANSLFTGLKLGATVILDPRWPTAESVVATLATQRASVLFSVPSLYRDLLKAGLAGALAQSGVRLCVSAGEALAASLRAEWKRLTGLTIVDGFGASETLVLALVDGDDGAGLQAAPGLTIDRLDRVDASERQHPQQRPHGPDLQDALNRRETQSPSEGRLDLMGRLDPLDRLDQVDGAKPAAIQSIGFFAARADAAPTAPGRLLIRGSSVALGYWQRPEAQAEHFRDGGFAPSDLFEPRAGGGWRFAGREDSLVKVHGRWVDLIELEQRIALGCPGIAEAAAVAVADADGVEAVALFFVAQPDAAPIDDASLNAHADRLPAYQRPRWLHRIDALPRTATGKLLRRRLRDLHAALAARETVPADADH